MEFLIHNKLNYTNYFTSSLKSIYCHIDINIAFLVISIVIIIYLYFIISTI